jgi:hypothetical protein
LYFSPRANLPTESASLIHTHFHNFWTTNLMAIVLLNFYMGIQIHPIWQQRTFAESLIMLFSIGNLNLYKLIQIKLTVIPNLYCCIYEFDWECYEDLWLLLDSQYMISHCHMIGSFFRFLSITAQYHSVLLLYIHPFNTLEKDHQWWLTDKHESYNATKMFTFSLYKKQYKNWFIIQTVWLG